MRRILGNYIVGERIGRGGMGDVFAGSHRFLGDPVAIKLVRQAGDQAVDALVAEATRIRAVDHRNVVRVLDVGRDEATHACYLVMERLDGGTLEARLQADAPLAESEVRRLGAAIADGAQAAHEAGIVHCDLKPSNVVMDGDEPKLVDFGIARQVAAGAGHRFGTPAYMAPEQIESGIATPSVDVWALGVILFRALTGRLPFADDADAPPQLSQAAPPLAASVTVAPELEALVDRCLARDPARRPPSMAEVARLLRDGADDRFTQDLGPAPPPVTPDPPPAAAAPRRGRALLVGVAGAGAVAAAIAVALLARGPSGSAPSDAAAVASSAADAGLAQRPPVDAEAPVATVEIAVKSRPPGADILVDGAFRGVTPARLRVRLPATIAARKQGFRTSSRRVEEPGPVELSLERVRRRRPPRTEPPRRPAGETLD